VQKFKRAPKNLFDKFGKYFPYSTVDVMIRNGESFLLAKRTIPPYKNKWNFPGGVIFKTEKLYAAAKRIAKEELNLDVKIEAFLGVYENPIPTRHDISHVFIASILRGTMKGDFQSSNLQFFKKPPKDMVPFQRKLLRDARQFLI